jgi:hypothetical protein
MWQVDNCILLWQIDVTMRVTFTMNVDCSVFAVSGAEKLTIFQHANKQVENLIETNASDPASCLSISMDGTVLALALRDQLNVYIVEKAKKRLEIVHTANLTHHIALLSMTPMCKFIAVLLITGDVLVYEVLTGIFICGIATG